MTLVPGTNAAPSPTARKPLADRAGHPGLVSRDAQTGHGAGGGKGMRTSCTPTPSSRGLSRPAARSEAGAAFGERQPVYIERYIAGRPRHKHYSRGPGDLPSPTWTPWVHLGERECSRSSAAHQKLRGQESPCVVRRGVPTCGVAWAPAEPRAGSPPPWAYVQRGNRGSSSWTHGVRKFLFPSSEDETRGSRSEHPVRCW
jgi:hypothetical protein